VNTTGRWIYGSVGIAFVSNAHIIGRITKLVSSSFSLRITYGSYRTYRRYMDDALSHPHS
jgi:hypothetical protein